MDVLTRTFSQGSSMDSANVASTHILRRHKNAPIADLGALYEYGLRGGTCIVCDSRVILVGATESVELQVFAKLLVLGNHYSYFLARHLWPFHCSSNSSQLQILILFVSLLLTF